MARLVLGAAGAVAGFYLGGPTGALMGFELGYGLSAGLDPNKKVLGPRLADLKGPSATYGAPIPYLEGAPRLAGNIIWASDKRTIATTTTTGGKGGPGVDSTTFTYEMDVFFVVADNQCQAVRRVWSNGKLVWSHADGADDATAQASLATPSWRDLRFYDGNSAQVADPTYEAAVGVGNAPAYRGRTTIMVEGLSLGGSGQPPVLTFEVVSEAAVSDALTTATVVDVPLPTHPITGPAGAGFSGIASYAGPDFDFFIGAFSGGVGGSYYYRVTASGLDPGYTLDDGSTRIGDEGGTVAYAAYVSGISDVPGYWMAQSDQGVGSGPVIDSVGGRWPSIWKTTANAYCRHASQTLILLVGTSPFTTFPHCIGIFTASVSPTPLTIAFQPRTAAYYGGEWIVAPETSDGTFRKYNTAATAQTGTMLDARGVGVGGGTMVTDTSTGELYFLDVAGTKLRLWNGSAWSDVMTSLPSTMLGENQRGITIIDGAVYSMHNVGTSARITRATPSTAVTISPPTLDQVVRRLCLRTGLLTDADIDVTDLASGVAIASGLVRAMAVSQVSTTRVTLDSLMIAYLFSAVESAGILRFVKRGAAPAMTIPYKDLGAGKDDQGEPLPLRRVNDIETAARVSVKFANTLNDFQDGLEAADRLVTNSTAEQVTEVPLGFEPTDAKKLADANTLDLAVGLTQLGPVSVTQKYAALEPTDVVLLTAVDGSLFRARIVKETISGGVLTFDLVLDDATVVNSAAVTDSNYVSTTLLSDLGDTTALLLDIPILRDADNSPGFYAAFRADDPWNSAELDRSADNVTYGKVLDVGDRAVMGQATTTLGDFTGGNVFDEVNSLTVNVGTGTLSSSTDDDLLTSDTNALLIGHEVIQFRTATLVSPGIYTLTGLRRGLRGTEWAMPGHTASERVVLLQTTGIRRVADQAADIGISNYWKAVTHGKSRASATTQTFTDTGIGLKPFAPVDLRLEVVDSANVFTWHRRSRLSSRFLATVDPPLGEATESYDVELYDVSDLLVSSATVTEPSYSLSGLVADTTAFVGLGFTPVWGMRTISGERVAVADQDLGAYTDHKYLVRLDTDNSVIQSSPGGALGIANQVLQFFNNGSALYAVTEDYYPTTPATYKNSKVQRFTRTTLDTLDAVNTAGTLGDYKGGAHDGTDVWVSEQLSGNLRRLNSTTLVSIASYAVTGGPGAMFYASGKLYVCCQFSDQVIRFDTTTHTEDWRVSTTHSPSDVLVVGSLVFVLGDAITVLNASTGAVVATHTYLTPTLRAQRNMCTFGSQVAIVIVAPNRILLLDSTTGLQSAIQASPAFDLHFAAGEFGGDLYLVVDDAVGHSANTRAYTSAPAALTGYAFTVYQNSATVGRGYHATLEL